MWLRHDLLDLGAGSLINRKEIKKKKNKNKKETKNNKTN